MSSVYVIQFDLNLAEKLKEGLEKQGFEILVPPHTLFQGKKKGVSCTLYTSGKLLVQGALMQEFIEFYLEPELLGTFSYGYGNVDLDLTARMGVDESGKGDFFGPLCIAGVFAEGELIPKLSTFGVKDSKKLQDASIVKIAALIKKNCAHHIVRINPAKYNELYEKFKNLNTLLAWGHATVIDHLFDKTGCERVIIDQFAAKHVVENALKKKKKSFLLTQRTKAEEDLVVAAASILARASFIEGLEGLEKKYEIILPKGASAATVAAGKNIVKKYGKEALKEFAKVHFKTYREITE